MRIIRGGRPDGKLEWVDVLFTPDCFYYFDDCDMTHTLCPNDTFFKWKA